MLICNLCGREIRIGTKRRPAKNIIYRNGTLQHKVCRTNTKTHKCTCEHKGLNFNVQTIPELRQVAAYTKLGAAVACKKPNEALVWFPEENRFITLKTELDSEQSRILNQDYAPMEVEIEERVDKVINQKEGTLFGMTQVVFMSHALYAITFLLLLFLFPKVGAFFQGMSIVGISYIMFGWVNYALKH